LVANNCLDNEKIDLEIEKYKDASKILKKDLGFENKFVLIYVGALIKRKKVDRLLESYKSIKQKYDHCALVIIGGGAMDSDLKEFVKKHELKDVFFAGKIFEGISKFFLLADLFILPGLGGLAIFEAMVHRLPVISASADGTEVDLIQDGKNGFVLKTDTVEELTDRISFFLEDIDLALQFGRKSREIVDTKINIKNKVRTFTSAIKNCTNKNNE
jgi:glycosyltransferase involved in cell wall biosynthesis